MTNCCPRIIDALPRCQTSPRSRDELAFHALQSLPMNANDWEALAKRCHDEAARLLNEEIFGVGLHLPVFFSIDELAWAAQS